MRAMAVSMMLAAALTGCGGDGTFGPRADTAATGGGGRTGDVDVCTLVPEADLLEAMGSTLTSLPPGERTGPSGPFTGCSWDTG